MTLEVTDTQAFSQNFDALGYGSQNTYDNLGFSNIILILLLIDNLVFVLGKSGLFSRCQRVNRRLQIEGVTLSATNMQFVILSCMELFICSMVSITPNHNAESTPGLFYLDEWTRTDKFAVFQTYAILCVLGLAFLLTVVVTSIKAYYLWK